MRKYKHHISYIVVIAILFGLTTISNSNIDSNSNNVSALSYSSSVGVGFTFNPTLSVSISPSDLVISNLVPGNTLDSNVINVSVASNASCGYTLSAIVNGNNSNLTHSNGTNIFSSIATDADLADLEDSEDTNIWGYSTSLDSGTTWSNYSGLSSSNSATLLNTNTNNTETGIDSIDFKITAKASNTQPSGTYTGTINFAAVTKHIPITLAEAYTSEGKTMINGFYTMQDMTSTICSKVEAIGAQLQVLDIRDNKLYWISKLADNKCWMTQNLDLAGGTKLYSETSDVPNMYPEGQDYYYQLSLSSPSDFSKFGVYNSGSILCAKDSPCYSYYSWPTTIASHDPVTQSTDTDADYSICPRNWRLPNSRSSALGDSDFYNLAIAYGMKKGAASDTSSATGGNFYKEAGPGTSPDFALAGGYDTPTFQWGGSAGLYWSSTSRNGQVYRLGFDKSSVKTTQSTSATGNRRFSVRCLAR